MTVEANAKVNLSLAVYGRRRDGYHELRSLVLPIELADDVVLEPSAGCVASSDSGFGDGDLAVRAACALDRAFPAAPGVRRGVRIHVEKRIPVGGGLGGGSADAAAVLRGLNELWGLGLPIEALAKIGAEVGSDVPALVLGQHFRAPVLMEGRGERVRLLAAGESGAVPAGDMWIVLANPGVSSSTAEVYARCTPRGGRAEGPLDAAEMFANDLMGPACALHPEIAAAISALARAGAADVMMSGSGSTVFGFAGSGESAARVAAAMGSAGCRAWVTRPLSSSAR